VPVELVNAERGLEEMGACCGALASRSPQQATTLWKADGGLALGSCESKSPDCRQTIAGLRRVGESQLNGRSDSSGSEDLMG
jgi:hypothetical protein